VNLREEITRGKAKYVAPVVSNVVILRYITKKINLCWIVWACGLYELY